LNCWAKVSMPTRTSLEMDRELIRQDFHRARVGQSIKLAVSF